MTKFVYVAQVGLYSEMYVGGVFETAEAAMAAYEGQWTRSAGTDWQGEDYEHWNNDLDWGKAVTIIREPVKS